MDHDSDEDIYDIDVDSDDDEDDEDDDDDDYIYDDEVFHNDQLDHSVHLNHIEDFPQILPSEIDQERFVNIRVNKNEDNEGDYDEVAKGEEEESYRRYVLDQLVGVKFSDRLETTSGGELKLVLSQQCEARLWGQNQGE